jgi:2-polyprenyl-3-methyl-5-hydroxy-6-metoxy-1,4-benzoquinol methylase
MKKKFKNKDFFEKQYKIFYDFKNDYGLYKLGLMSNFTWNNDPKRLLFMMSRYKFVSKMLSGTKKCFEIGCGDAFGSRIVSQNVKNLTALDADEVFIDYNKKLNKINSKYKITYLHHDILKKPTNLKYDSGYALDVLEHIKPSKNDAFFKNIIKSLVINGVFIIGMPSLESQKYASKESIEGHVNCLSGEKLKNLSMKYFKNVFIFSMNDEVLHTGFYPMSNYLFALCVGIKK